MYYLTYGFLYLLSLLPMWALYGISNGIYGLIYYVFGYRKKVVLQNLAIAFPKKTERERVQIAKQFYKNFVDNFIETIKLLSADQKFLREHFTGDASVLQYLYDKGLRCQVHLGHNFNWEMASVAMPLHMQYLFLVVYMPIKNRAFERLFLKLRGTQGTKLIPATDMKKGLMPYRDEQYLLALVADQVPGNVAKAYWLYFFNKPTPFVRGPERGARAGNIPVVFATITKSKRGHYEFHLTLATEQPASLPEGELTRQYIRHLEKVIDEAPDMWLWSHRRWKREWKPEYAQAWIDTAPPPSGD